MNAIVSICHFCELHGPRVVFCTQAFRDLPDFDALTGVEAPPVIGSRLGHHEGQPEESDLWKYGRNLKDNPAEMKNGTPNETCVACRSFPHTQPGFISNDDSAKVSYVTSQYPLQSELYSLVHLACIRSLSCEVCPGKEGPIYFGDEARGHVLSYTFFLQDVLARGFQRWYSIMVLMKDKMLLLNSWPFIVRHLKQTISHLQESASKIYESEESKVSHRALRSAIMNDNYRRQRVAGQPRSLSELVGEEQVWSGLHSSFTWLLKAGGLRLQERLVEGPPVTQLIMDGSESSGTNLNVRELYNKIGPYTFNRLTHHLLIGRQIIVRGSSANAVSTVVQSLQPLIPKHCFKAINFSPHYIDSASCNILGLHSLVKVPLSVLATGNICVLELFAKESTGESGTQSNIPRVSAIPNHSLSAQEIHRIKSSLQEKEMKNADFSELLKSYNIQISQEGTLPAKPPQLLNRIETALSNPTLTPATLMVYLSTILYEWINKVKVWMQVQNANKTIPPEQRSPVSSQSTITRTPSIPILRSPVHQPFLSRSPVLSGGLTAGLLEATANSQDNSRHQLLSALGATEWDVPLLEFWALKFHPNSV
ncbi:hypothetical protein Pcinc_012469 [Petrolisthes cinctipes]|uniref:Folliculin n=1 Tax=Petrolisthes cinctipes TaxID=88211 RepID=A0AAE1KVC6_PETCI|nr:hypothetical protein Pcinc_012469 [Petrolisthes cinctipes]